MKHSKSVFVFSVLIIVMFCTLGFFSRPYPFDEFGFYNRLAKEGFIQAQITMYTNWSGRIFNSFIVFSSVFFRLETIQPFIALTVTLTYALACLFLVSAIFPALTLFVKLSLSLMACALTLCFTYSLYETFYWLPGAPYFLSQTLILFALGLALKAFKGSRSSFIICVIVLFLNAMNLEQPCVFQGIIAFLAMIFFSVRGNKKCALMCGAFWLVSVAGFCVVYFSPGTAVRMSWMSQANSIFSKILGGFISAFSMGFLNTFQFFAKPLLYAVLFFLPATAAKIPPADEKLSRSLKSWHIVASMFFISMFMQFMMGVISSGTSGLPERGVSLSMWLMYFTWNILWVFFYRGKLISSEGFRNFCAKFRWPALILSVLISANFRDCVMDLRIAPQYAAEYDGNVNMILEQRKDGITELHIPSLKNRPALISDFDPSMTWAYSSIAQYYGAENLYVVPHELFGDSEAVKKLESGDLEPLEKLAVNGDINSMLYLGTSRDPYMSGGPNTNAQEAEKWYKMGSEKGERRCMRRIARVMLKRNFPEAVCWLLKYHIFTTRL